MIKKIASILTIMLVGMVLAGCQEVRDSAELTKILQTDIKLTQCYWTITHTDTIPIGQNQYRIHAVGFLDEDYAISIHDKYDWTIEDQKPDIDKIKYICDAKNIKDINFNSLVSNEKFSMHNSSSYYVQCFFDFDKGLVFIQVDYSADKD